MSWQTGFLEAASDLEITQEEVTSLVSDTVYSAIRSMFMLGIMTMGVKGFYSILGPKKYAEQEEEVLEMAEEIW